MKNELIKNNTTYFLQLFVLQFYFFVMYFTNIASASLTDDKLNTSFSWGNEGLAAREYLACENISCITIEDAISSVLSQNFSSKERTELILKKREGILSQLRTGGNYFELIGKYKYFIFPSPWYSWNESELFNQAEKYSYLAFLQDQLRDTEYLYFSIHQLILERKIYYYYIDKITALINTLSDDLKKKNIAINREILVLEQLLSSLKIDATIVGMIISPEKLDIVKDAFLLSNNYNENIGINELTLPDLNQAKHFSQSELTLLIDKAIKSSKTIKSLKYLKRASISTQKPRTYSFYSDGQILEYKISKNNINILDAQEDKIKSMIKNSFYKIGITQENLINTHKQHTNMRINNIELINLLLDNYIKNGILDIYSFENAIKLGVKVDLELNLTQHRYLMLTSQIERLLLDNDKYKLTVKYILKKNNPNTSL